MEFTNGLHVDMIESVLNEIFLGCAGPVGCHVVAAHLPFVAGRLCTTRSRTEFAKTGSGQT
jgi:hypothetical protein